MTSNRETREARAARAAQVVDNLEFQRAFTQARANIIAEMEKLELTGANDAHAAQLVTQLQAATNFKRELVRLISAGARSVRRADRDSDLASP